MIFSNPYLLLQSGELKKKSDFIGKYDIALNLRETNNLHQKRE